LHFIAWPGLQWSTSNSAGHGGQQPAFFRGSALSIPRDFEYEIEKYEEYAKVAIRLVEMALATEARMYETLADLCYEKASMLRTVEIVGSKDKQKRQSGSEQGLPLGITARAFLNCFKAICGRTEIYCQHQDGHVQFSASVSHSELGFGDGEVVATLECAVPLLKPEP
jgi:hypothetical protein